ncbi:uncharacterized protein LOC114646147 isoform X1 [Erpetoichthys calabaricus]|uniref:uncharacterized protein LOC114646147 isoform X1 n=2 Tax=Erpetoichthys calabaricus TaxID=27687 RepID=UPI00109F892A|nr:uncharacterized protein LOC114646147 isoform X1 [Erpetoichthys calabaricus]
MAVIYWLRITQLNGEEDCEEENRKEEEGPLCMDQQGNSLHSEKMTHSPLQFVAGKKDEIEAVMDIFEKGTEVIVEVVGELFPIFQVVAPVVKLALDNMESKEARFMKEQFQKIEDELGEISDELRNISNELDKTRMEEECFTIEEDLRNQFENYIEFLNVGKNFKKAKRKVFLDHFEATKGEDGLETLYQAVMEEYTFGKSILKIVMEYHKRDRRILEDFCARLIKLFFMGIISLLAYTALKGNEEDETPERWEEKMEDVEEIKRKWQGKMEAIEKKIKAVVEDCKTNFAQQAKEDTEQLLRGNKEIKSKEFTDNVLEFLKKKYYWVSWSVRVYYHSVNWFKDFRTGKNYHNITGSSHFEFSDINNVNVVVSYCVEPKIIDKSKVRQLIEEQKKDNNMVAVTQVFAESFPSCVVHAVNHHKDVYESSNFQPEYYYSGQFKNCVLCIHSD